MVISEDERFYRKNVSDFPDYYENQKDKRPYSTVSGDVMKVNRITKPQAAFRRKFY